MAEILASLDDINAELPSDEETPVVVADEDNTSLLQISTARVVRGYLSRIYPVATLVSWTVPNNTPELIRTAAGKLIAAQLYFNKTAQQTTAIEDNSFAQKRYDEAMSILKDIVDGSVTLVEVTDITGESEMSDLDYFPVDSTDRSFTKSQLF